MAFVKILPRIRGSSKKIRVSFTGDKTIYANVFLGKKLLEELHWAIDGRAYLYFDDEDIGLWKIEKAPAEETTSSFKLVPNKSKTVSKIQFRAPENTSIVKDEKKTKEVEFEISNGCIILKNAI